VPDVARAQIRGLDKLFKSCPELCACRLGHS
jgi:hypothetical protein